MTKLLLITLLLFSTNSLAKPESYYVKKHCVGEIEYQLKDGTRVDCLSIGYAIEYDFANKYYEALGQSMHYANVTGLNAGIVLVLRSYKDHKYIKRLVRMIERFNIPVELWTVTAENFKHR
jgi:hypothetical protein